MMARSEQSWLEQTRALVLRNDSAGAYASASAALLEHPRSFELRRVLAGVCQQINMKTRSESLLWELQRERPGDFATAMTLAGMLLAQTRSQAAAQVLRDCFAHDEQDPELAIKAIELLDEAGRKHDAAAIADIALAAAPGDARLHAYAGMLQIQLGDFERARSHYEFALRHSPQACEWNAPLGLATTQRYRDPAHSDFAAFRECLQRDDLSGRARSTLLFAMGKAHDDIGDYARAASYFRQANVIAHSLTRWSRKDWRRAVEARLAAPPIPDRLTPSDDFIPVFIVGMPRSGTTLLAELLSRYPLVCNRGELPWIAKLTQWPELAATPRAEALKRAAEFYQKQARQDDASDARWFIDKQPLNFRYVDLMLAMFPNARIVFCQRGARDTALSLWTQTFLEDVQGYAYDFADIKTVMHDCSRLAAHWSKRYPDSVRPLQYESLIADSLGTLSALAAWIGLREGTADQAPTPAISTASLWQARQPINTRSVGRWRHYAPHVSELLLFSE